MRIFLLKISVALTIALSMHVAAGYFSGGKTDDFYLRFTTPKTKSMIIGSSRAAQGIQPDSLHESCVILGYETPILNFAFTSMASPFGETYFKAIQYKLDTNTSSGLFIICVEPYTLGEFANEIDKPYDIKRNEENGPLYNARFLNSYPNWEYLVKHYSNGWGRMVLTSFGLYNTTTELHPNGWLEVNVEVDSASAKARAYDVLYDKRSDIGKFALSSYRLQWLRQTISYLKRFGEVVMIRVPISKEFFEFEQSLLPEFDHAMLAEAHYHDIPFKTFQDIPESLEFKDGHHMQLTATAIFSSTLNRWLMRKENTDSLCIMGS